MSSGSEKVVVSSNDQTYRSGIEQSPNLRTYGSFNSRNMDDGGGNSTEQSYRINREPQLNDDAQQSLHDFRANSNFPQNGNNTDEQYQLIEERIQSFTSISSSTSAATGDLPEQQLQQSQQLPSETMIIAGSVANLCSATLGAGVLALPYAVYQSGIIVGVLLLVGSAAATICSIDLISCACHVYSSNTYEALTDTVLGKNYRRAIECSIVLFSIGCAVAYVIAVGDILEKSHMLILGDSRNWTIVLVWLLAMVPLSLFRTMQNLQFASAFGIASIGILVLAAAIHLIQDVKEDVDEGDDSNAGESISRVLSSCLWPANGIVSVLTACPIILFAFSCQCNVCAIFAELPDKVAAPSADHREQQSENHQLSGSPQQYTDPEHGTRMDEMATSGHPVSLMTNTFAPHSPQELHAGSTAAQKDALMHKVTLCSVLICAALYGMISFITLSDFGKDTLPNLLSSYRPVGVMQIAMSAMAVAVVMAFPLNIFPARVTIIGLFHELQVDSPAENDDAIQMNVEESLTQSFSNSLAHQATEPTLTTALIPRTGQQNEQGNKKEGDTEFDPLYISWTNHIALTLFMTTVTLGFALVLPNISVVFGLLGGTASSFLGFCVPGLFGLQLSRDLFPSVQNDEVMRPAAPANSTNVGICSSKFKLELTSWALLIGGICVGILTTAVTFYNTFMG